MTDFYLDYMGNDYNGGGYDASISGATVNLASGQPYAALTASGLECTAGSTEITSVHGGFTSDMIGNTMNIYGGTDYTWGIYTISGVPDANTLLVDTSPAASTSVSGLAKIGGSWLTLENLKKNSGGFSYFFYNAASAGDRVFIKGNGDNNPASGQYMARAYSVFSTGSSQNPIVFQGYNGRPSFDITGGNLFIHSSDYHYISRIKFLGGAGNWESYPCVYGGMNTVIDDCIFDQRGNAVGGFRGGITNCYLYSSIYPFTGTAGYTAIQIPDYGVACNYNLVQNYKGNGIVTQNIQSLEENVIDNIAGVGIKYNPSSYFGTIRNNTINKCLSHGIFLNTTKVMRVVGNLITNCSGVGIINDSSSYQDYIISETYINYNGFYNNLLNESGYNNTGSENISVSQDPYLNEPSGDLTLNSNQGGGLDLRGVDFFQNKLVNFNSYRDIGALQAYDK
ncbi:MAG: hypothetical protein GY920_04205 [Aliivibrio sp.]|nr:hypothetical protein [Aliivibrio sp.]